MVLYINYESSSRLRGAPGIRRRDLPVEPPRNYMARAAAVAVGILAVIHLGISAVEMFFWLNPAVYQRLGFSAEQASKAHPIVMNAGLYNGFVAAGLFWGAFGGDRSFQVRVFFLSCVIIAGIFG